MSLQDAHVSCLSQLLSASFSFSSPSTQRIKSYHPMRFPANLFRLHATLHRSRTPIIHCPPLPTFIAPHGLHPNLSPGYSSPFFPVSTQASFHFITHPHTSCHNSLHAIASSYFLPTARALVFVFLVRRVSPCE
jgi:hypothetical protein